PVGSGRFRDTCLLADIGKSAVAIVAIQRMSSSGHSNGPTFNRDTFPVAIRVLSRNRRVFEREMHVVGNEQIEIAVAIIVNETASRSPTLLLVPKASTLGYVSKRAIAVVAIQTVLSEVSTKNVLETVVVVIADAHAGGPTRRLQTCLFRDIGKGTV